MTEDAPRRPRLDTIDLPRAIALPAMAIFHFAFDLSHFGLIDTDVPADPAWRWFARLIAGSFLTLVGIGLVLATRDGLDRAAFLRRLVLVAGGALLVSLVTAFALPQDMIFFGILHHIALASVLALPFLRLPAWLVGLAAALCFALPQLAWPAALDARWLLWLGLSQAPVRAADFVPLFPWFGCVLAGTVLARTLVLPAIGRGGLRWQARGIVTRAMAWAGRHSLLIYLIHQPLLIGAILLYLQLQPVPVAEEQPFLSACERNCRAPGAEAGLCRRICGCTVEGLKRDGLWRKALDDALSPTELAQTQGIARACTRP